MVLVMWMSWMNSKANIEITNATIKDIEELM